MGTYRHTIEVEARFVDNLTGGADSASRAISDVGDSARKATVEVKKLDRADATPDVDLDTSRFTRSMDKINRLLDKFKKVHTAALNLREGDTYQRLKKITETVEGLSRKSWDIALKVKNFTMAPFNAVRNALFSIQTLATTIFAGIAAKKLIINPINTADAYSGALSGFSNQLGASAGQKMMDQLDAFALKTPFKTSGVIGNAQKMLAMGWNAETLIEDMEIIGDAAAATGKLDQGLESIVRALAQIKTKGKLSTEELNQLAEAGIAAKPILAEALGYGTGDEGLAALAADLEDGAIGSEKAIEALLRGMQKYKGMMDAMANEQASGLIAQIQDAFEVSVVRRWGQGLQDGAKRGLGTVVELLDNAREGLDEFGEMLYDIGYEASNWVADRFEGMMNRVLEITDTFEFKNASLKDKVSMLWNGVIADPLKEWWEGGGRAKTIETAGEIGGWMGEALTKGLLAVFGATDFLKEGETDLSTGAEIAKSFSQSFRDNFDASAVTDKLVEAISNVWGALPAWGKALLIGYGGSKLAIGGMNLISGIAGGVQGIGNFIGSASGMTGLLGFGTKAAINLGAGNLAGGASLGAAGLSALGLGATAGGIAAIASAGKGLFDLYGSYKAIERGDKTEGGALATSGFSALGGVGLGAATGAAIGSVVPVLGTAVGALIGAGVGGIAGWIGGDKFADKIRAAKYESEAMKEAIKDSKMSAEELANEFAKAKWENAAKHFGNIKLSMEEIASLVENIVWGDDLGNFENFATATKTAKANLQSIKTAAQSADKWMWKAGLGVKFNADDQEAMMATFDEYISAAQSYLQNKHYEFTTSAALILDLESAAGKAILEGGNSYFGGVTTELDAATRELSEAIMSALADGIIEAPEEEVIIAAQQKIAEIMEKIASAESAADMELIKVKFGSGNLDNESFENFMTQMTASLEERINSTDEAFTAQVTNLKLRFPDGGEEYDAAFQALVDGYEAKVESVKAEIENVELDIISKAYADVFGADVKEDLKNALDKMANSGEPLTSITDEQLGKWLGLDNIEGQGETLANLRDWLGQIIEQLEIMVDEEAPATMKKSTNLDWSIWSTPYIENPVILNQEDVGIDDTYEATTTWNLYGKLGKISPVPNPTIQQYGILPSRTFTQTINIQGVLGETSFPSYAQYRQSKLPGGYANGGFVSGGAKLVTVAEEGTPEVIIPLGSHRRARGLDLWEKAGRMLGVGGFANGGFTMGNRDEGIRFHAAGGVGGGAQVNVGGVSVTIQVDARGSENVVDAIRAQSGEIAEAVAGILADELGDQFSNTPRRTA